MLLVFPFFFQCSGRSPANEVKIGGIIYQAVCNFHLKCFSSHAIYTYSTERNEAVIYLHDTILAALDAYPHEFLFVLGIARHCDLLLSPHVVRARRLITEWGTGARNLVQQ